MEKKSWVFFALFCIFLMQITDIQAQKIEKSIVLKWTDNTIYPISDDNIKEFLHFEEAVYTLEQPTLPSFYQKVTVDNFFSDYNVSISDAKFESLNSHDCALIPSDFNQTSVSVKVTSAFERKNTFALISFIPIIQTGKGQYSRLISATITIEGRGIAAKKGKREYAGQSVLASGKWYKFSVNKTGIFKVNYSDLTAMGMTGTLSSSELALFGNGGGMLPEANSASRIDDIQEIPIQIFDGGDGTMDVGDYFIFYGQSPHSWKYDTTEGHFTHTTNIYSDNTYYFVTNSAGIGEKKRISVMDNSAMTANLTVTDYIHYDFYEVDQYNLSETGREWLGDLFDVTTTRTYTFSVPGYKQSTGRLVASVAGVSSTSSHVSFKVNQTSIGQEYLTPIGSSTLATLNKATFNFTPTSSTLSVTLDYDKPTTSSSAYLNWLEIEIPCNLTMHSAQFPFCNPSTVGTGNITQFNISNANSTTTVWDVTETGKVCRMLLTAGNGYYSFKAKTDSLRQYYAFNGTDYLSVTPMSAVANQNLHGTSEVDMVIIAYPSFVTQANRLAAFRQTNDGLTVKVVPIQQVYNEFSSGAQDPMAIRDYMKMIYDKSDKTYPKYLLLFGRPCYDYRGRVDGTSIYIPNYQYATRGNVISENDFNSNDDTFGFLDDNEGSNATGLFDLAIGRFPSSTVAQAMTAVDKSIRYTTHTNLVEDNSAKISNLGDWRNMIAYVADDEDFNDFITAADDFATIVKTANPNINFDKIYLDAFQQVSNAGGQRYPDANTAINNRMNRGSLFFTYIGHSGKDGWATERVLENSDINNWTNKYNQPVMLTLSCSFGYYDRPAVSPAELVFFNSNGGASALITTSREAWSTPNNTYGRYLFSKMFNHDSGRYPTIGELQMAAKNQYGGGSTSLAMIYLLGDPSMPLAMPKYNIVTDSMNHISVNSALDTARAFSKITVSGRIVDDNGQIIENFNGSVFPSVYDKKIIATTLSNDPASPAFDFEVQKNILFKGNSTVSNGHFTFSFYVPKDIDYNFGNGKISYYAHSANQDAAGSFTNFIIGGTDTNGLDDKEGPEIELYMNDEQFVNGGLVNENPILIAKIKDNYGINTTGNGIGHDLTAILDGSTETQIVLNDYYETEKDSSNMGTVRYSLSDLSVGSHTITVRAWDISNNHSESELSFTVASENKLTLSHILNYPNPFTTHTDFYFEQNQNGGIFDIQIQIYTISGKLLRTIHTTQTIEGNRCQGISWDGRDDYGDKIGKGVYMYKLRVKNQSNETAEQIEKLVIL